MSPHLHKKLKNSIFKRPLVNYRIRAPEVRLIDKTGKQLGILSIEKALRIAGERNLDLIQVTEKVIPPVCKIMDYGKYLYQEKKKEKLSPKSPGELKGIRLGFGISQHDLEVRAKLAEKFLKKGHKVRVELILRGRQKALPEFAREKMNQFLKILEGILPIKIERGLKRESRGFIMIISKSKEDKSSS